MFQHEWTSQTSIQYNYFIKNFFFFKYLIDLRGSYTRDYECTQFVVGPPKGRYTHTGIVPVLLIQRKSSKIILKSLIQKCINGTKDKTEEFYGNQYIHNLELKG